MTMETKVRCYAVVLNTSIGERHGKMMVKRQNNRLLGEITLFNHKEKFEGLFERNGQCQISGKIVTLTKVLPYEASGILLHDRVHLVVQTAKEKYELTGVPLKKEGV